MVAKLFLLQFAIFSRYFVKLARNDFHRNPITAQIISLAFLVSANPAVAGRHKIVLQPSLINLRTPLEIMN